ncbi:diaphanous 1, putative [Babesia ovata]|uniref:Diaphanous 1, putative n=1 Tax=Babesia ovata TaxID=189622 RepID=A0A2H6KHS8_9APIC|nr:diaphanous 1, putative [Babesia ovata]GBE62544.1 diaphanous 1, putative [Babesia ovata]
MLLLEIGRVVPEVAVEVEILLQRHPAALQEQPKLAAGVVLYMPAANVMGENAAHAGRECQREHAIDVGKTQALAAVRLEGAARMVDGQIRLGEDAHKSGQAFVHKWQSRLQAAGLVE